MQRHIVCNPQFLKQLQEQYALFVDDGAQRGVWFVEFTPTTALRFVNAVNNRLPCYALHSALSRRAVAEHGALFAFDSAVHFKSLPELHAYCAQLRAAGDSEGLQAAHPAALRALNTRQFDHVVKTLSVCEPQKGELCFAFVFVDERNGVVACDPLIFNVRAVAGDQYMHLRALAAMHYADLQLFIHRAMLELGDGNVVDQLRKLHYSYAHMTLRLNNLLPPDGSIDVLTLHLAARCKHGQCGRCYAVNAQRRCPHCLLFRYCNDECRRAHYEHGSFIDEAADESVKLAMCVPHSYACSMVRSAAQLWGQFPPTINRTTLIELLSAAQAEVSKNFQYTPDDAAAAAAENRTTDE